jgi:anti-sigma regulatory factor (Ser/Thr protein kinase)
LIGKAAKSGDIMFEILLNAVKFAISKDAHSSANALVSMFSKSPEWRKVICTIEARVAISEQERLHFLEDLIVSKLHNLSYQEETCQRFRVVFRELVDNRLQHVCKDGNQPVRLVVDTSPTYVSLTVYNPKGSPVDLTSWLQVGTLHLRESKKEGRGRGLLLAARKADTLEGVKSQAVKASLYRDVVCFEKVNLKSLTVVTVLAGHSNPSLGRRLTEYLENINASSLILCLDPREISKGHLDRLISRASKDLPELSELFELFELLAEKKKADKRARMFAEYDIGKVPLDSKVLKRALTGLKGFAAKRSRQSKQSVRLVCSDADIADLLPKDIVSESVAQAYRDLKNL